jgi:hypothetical protein
LAPEPPEEDPTAPVLLPDALTPPLPATAPAAAGVVALPETGSPVAGPKPCVLDPPPLPTPTEDTFCSGATVGTISAINRNAAAMTTAGP